MPEPRRTKGRFSRRVSVLRRAPARLLSNEFLISASHLAIRRWDRLTPEQQDRFRELSGRARGDSKVHLKSSERKELRETWAKLEVQGLIREVLARAAARDGERRRG